MNINLSKLLLRALKSAIQTFGGTMGAVSLGWIDLDALKIGILAAVMAGVSVLWNAAMTWANMADDFKGDA